jgi:hypothetical protein
VFFIHENKMIQSPQVQIRVENKFHITAILDSGSEVNLLSERVYGNLLKTGVGLPSLPVGGVVLVTSFGKRSKRIRQQTLISFQIGDLFESVFLVSSQMSNQAIIGCQMLKEYGIYLDFEREIISYIRDDVLKEQPFSRKEHIRLKDSDDREGKSSLDPTATKSCSTSNASHQANTNSQ